MNQLTEIEIVKSILTYREEVLDLISDLDYSFFSYPPVKVIIYLLNKYVKKFNKFPNYTELKIFLQDNISEIDLPIDEIQRKIELQKIDSILDFLNKPKEELIEKVLNLDQLKQTLEKLVKRSLLIRNIENLKEIISTGEKVEETLESLQKKIEKHTFAIDEGKTIDWFLSLEKPIRKNLRKSGFLFLDTYMQGGLGAGEIALIASPPGIGKTTFLCNLMYNYIILYENIPVIYITLELEEAQIFTRLLCIYLEVPFFTFRDKTPKEVIQEIRSKKEVNVNEIQRIFQNVYIKYFSPGTFVQEITKYLKIISKSKKEKPIVLIDYLNEIDFPYTKELWIKMERIMTELDKTAVDLEIPIWIACQAHSKAKKIKNKEDKNIFDIKDLYGSKVGITKKISFGIGLTYDYETNLVKLSFFKNRLEGKVNDIATLIYDRKTNKLRMTEKEDLSTIDIDEIDFDLKEENIKNEKKDIDDLIPF